LLIEQPFASLHEHSLVPFEHRVCLDESIGSLNDIYLVEALDAGDVLNLKPFRLGGLWDTWQAAQVVSP
jgi:L-alanine-DL-glutamate epimerase-like enolase superfamily enzyme